MFFGYGNLIKDPNVQSVEYNHLDLPVSITSAQGSIEIVYDADGTKLQQIETDAEGNQVQTTYIGPMEYVNDRRSSLYFAGGRVMYNATLESPSGEVTQDFVEWSISDHLGNTRIRYIDKDNDNQITVSKADDAVDELSGSYHYYPFGLVMEGNFSDHQGLTEKYQYNGIEHSSVIGSGIGLTTYRVHDAAIGRWWQVDPKAEYLYGLSPYNAMNNNPITFNDPNGDIAPLLILGAAALGGSFNLYRNWDNINSFGDGLAAFGIGAGAGALGAITGGAAAGLIGTAGVTASAGSVIASGAVGGAAGLGVDAAFQETGNALYFGDASFGEALGHGLLSGLKGAAIGGVTGGALAGVGVLAGSFTKGTTTEIVQNTTEGAAPLGYAETGTNTITTTIYGTAGDNLAAGATAAARTVSQSANSSTKALTNFYPPNNGALGKWSTEYLTPGTIIDRYGSGFGRYFSPQGTPLNMRALPPGNTGALNTFKVVKPFPVQSSTVAPAYGKIGLGRQYLSPVNANTLLKRGIIVPF